MGIFSFNDKGRDRPEPDNPFLLFWYRYANRFFHLLRMNLIFFLITLPFYVWAMTIYNSYIVEKGLKGIALMPAFIAYGLGSIPLVIQIILVAVSALCLGPAWAGLTFVAGKYAQGEHAWVWADFKSAFRQNLKQSMVIGIIEALIVFVTFYYLMGSNTFLGEFSGIARLLWFILLLIYLSCRMYLFPMMVTVELPLGQIFKNSLILALIKPLRGLLGLAVLLVLLILSYFADFVIVTLFAYSFYAFASSAITYPVMEKYVFSPDQKRKGDN